MSTLHASVRRFTWFHDPSRPRRLLKIALWLLGLAVVRLVCYFAGWDLRARFARLCDTMSEITIGYIVLGVFFQTVQTTLTAVAWYYILAAGYPDGGVRYR